MARVCWGYMVPPGDGPYSRWVLYLECSSFIQFIAAYELSTPLIFAHNVLADCCGISGLLPDHGQVCNPWIKWGTPHSLMTFSWLSVVTFSNSIYCVGPGVGYAAAGGLICINQVLRAKAQTVWPCTNKPCKPDNKHTVSLTVLLLLTSIQLQAVTRSHEGPDDPLTDEINPEDRVIQEFQLCTLAPEWVPYNSIN